MFSVILLSVVYYSVMLSVLILNVVMLNVLVPLFFLLSEKKFFLSQKANPIKLFISGCSKLAVL